MEIDRVESVPVAIPVEEPVSLSNRTLTYRDHVITYVRTESGLEDIGYSLGYEGGQPHRRDSGVAPRADRRRRRPARHRVAVARDVRQDGPVRPGILSRAISTVDFALWDVKAKAAGRQSISEEADRVAAVRDEISPETTLLLDANGAWSGATEATRACRAFEQTN